MVDYSYYKTIPIGSLLTRHSNEEQSFIEQLPNLPPTVIDLLLSSKTGAYIRGLGKIFNLSLDKLYVIAFNILQISLGTREIKQLSTTLERDLKIPSSMAVKMALEIERDLFAPVMLELNQYLAQQKQQLPQTMQPPVAQAGGARNVLDLKSQPRPPLPPPIPKR